MNKLVHFKGVGVLLTLEEAAKWLKELDSQIRQWVPKDPWNDKIGGFDRELRNLTAEEWTDVVELVEKFEFPCVLHPGPYGFCLQVHAVSDFQGVSDMLLRITDHQFPFPSASQGFAGQEKTLSQLSPLVYRKRNKELLSWYGFEPLYRNICQYAY